MCGIEDVENSAALDLFGHVLHACLAVGRLCPARFRLTPAILGSRACEKDKLEQEDRSEMNGMRREACRVWSSLPGQAARFLAAAIRVAGSDAGSGGHAGRAVPSREAVGRELLSLIFGLQGGQPLPEVLVELARAPDSRHALEELEHQVSGALEADPARVPRAVAAIAAFYWQRADAGDLGALVELSMSRQPPAKTRT